MPTPAAVLTAANCDACFGSSEYTLLLIQNQLLRQIAIALDPMATTDPATLLNQANCLACFAPSEYALLLMNGVLLTQIDDAITGGGVLPPPLGAAPEIYQGTFNDPNGNVIPNFPEFPARYSQLESSGGTGVEFHWQPGSPDPATGHWI